ncbi:hypothetical protein QQP08_010076 [Theobroma cacao]|nr:hypothetical protein QQP08_010076 [Theobroma cacao]
MPFNFIASRQMQMKVFLGWLSSTFVFQTFIPCHMTGSGLVFAESSNLTSVWAAHVSTDPSLPFATVTISSFEQSIVARHLVAMAFVLWLFQFVPQSWWRLFSQGGCCHLQFLGVLMVVVFFTIKEPVGIDALGILLSCYDPLKLLTDNMQRVSMPANSELKVNNSRTRSKHFVNLPIVELGCKHQNGELILSNWWYPSQQINAKTLECDEWMMKQEGAKLNKFAMRGHLFCKVKRKCGVKG